MWHFGLTQAFFKTQHTFISVNSVKNCPKAVWLNVSLGQKYFMASLGKFLYDSSKLPPLPDEWVYPPSQPPLLPPGWQPNPDSGWPLWLPLRGQTRDLWPSLSGHLHRDQWATSVSQPDKEHHEPVCLLPGPWLWLQRGLPAPCQWKLLCEYSSHIYANPTQLALQAGSIEHSKYLKDV